MRFTIDVSTVKGVDGTTRGWESRVLVSGSAPRTPDSDAEAAILAEPRTIGRLEVNGEVFPLPPDGEAGLPDGLSADDLADAFRSLMDHSAGDGAVKRFGRYLFEVLLGRTRWNQIDSSAGPKPIELSLTWAADDVTLNRLPWEIMHHGCSSDGDGHRGFLAAEPEVVITRRVAGTSGPRHQIDELPSPPRVLFVIGSTPSDPDIRPGAEYLELLRDLDRRGHYLHRRLLVEATTATLEEEIKRFRPTVVHVICHGLIADTGRPSLEFRKSAGSREADYVDARRLQMALETLRADENAPLPMVVVLNACSTATSDEIDVGRPFAAELVESGVPVVIGMAGRVADQACRLFTSGFYQALLEGGEIGRAAARGRRAAIAHGGYDPSSQIDWALPVLYLSEAVGEARLDVKKNDAELERLQQAQEFCRQDEYPAFCGRWDFYQLYDKLMTGNKLQFAAVSVHRQDVTNPAQPQPQYGSSRLLRELAAQATRDGHVPILVSRDWLRLNRWPGGLVDFLDCVMDATNLTVQVLSGISTHNTLNVDWDWTYLPRFRNSYPQAAPVDDLPSDRGKELAKSGLRPEDRLAKALTFDLLELRRLVCAQRGEDEDSDTKLLLLIDDFHQLVYSDELLAFLDKQHGLRDPRAVTKTRCVITYFDTAVNGQEHTVDDVKDWANSHGVAHVQLKPLHGEIDYRNPRENPDSFEKAVLVYKHFLLSWRFAGQRIPLSIALPDGDADFEWFISSLAQTSKGMPAELSRDPVTYLIFALKNRTSNPVLRVADDEDALVDLDANLPKRG